MLHRVDISNFRSCKNLTLDKINGLLALVGRNGAGKTNILRAIEWAALTATSTQPVEMGGAVDYYAFLNHQLPRVALTFSPLSGEEYEYVLEVAPQPSPDPKQPQFNIQINETLSVVSSGTSVPLVSRSADKAKLHDRNQELSLGASTPLLKVLLAILPETDPLNTRLREITNYLESVRYYSLEVAASESDRLVHAKNYNEWAKNAQKNGPGGSVVMRLLHMHLTRPEDFEELVSLVGKDGLGLVSVIEVQPISLRHDLPSGDSGQDLVIETPQQPDFYHVSFVPSGYERSSMLRRFGFEDLSFGTQRLLTIVTAIIFDRSSVLLLEQPEDGIHVGLLHKLQPLFKAYSDSMQFLLASHSRDILDRFDPENIRLVTLSETHTTARSLQPHEIELAEQFMDEEGPLSDFIETLQGD